MRTFFLWCLFFTNFPLRLFWYLFVRDRYDDPVGKRDD